MAKLRKMQSIDDDEDSVDLATSAAGRPMWMTVLRSHAAEWLGALPKDLTSITSRHSPLSRIFTREVSIGQQLLKRIRRDLSELIDVCDGNLKQTNELRVLISDINQGELDLVYSCRH